MNLLIVISFGLQLRKLEVMGSSQLAKMASLLNWLNPKMIESFTEQS